VLRRTPADTQTATVVEATGAESMGAAERVPALPQHNAEAAESTSDDFSVGLVALAEGGRERGYVTYDGILQQFPGIELNDDQVSELYTALSAQGIEIVEEAKEKENEAPAIRCQCPRCGGKAVSIYWGTVPPPGTDPARDTLVKLGFVEWGLDVARPEGGPDLHCRACGVYWTIPALDARVRESSDVPNTKPAGMRSRPEGDWTPVEWLEHRLRQRA
jgi:hypothetical protein